MHIDAGLGSASHRADRESEEGSLRSFVSAAVEGIIAMVEAGSMPLQDTSISSSDSVRHLARLTQRAALAMSIFGAVTGTVPEAKSTGRPEAPITMVHRRESLAVDKAAAKEQIDAAKLAESVMRTVEGEFSNMEAIRKGIENLTREIADEMLAKRQVGAGSRRPVPDAVRQAIQASEAIGMRFNTEEEQVQMNAKRLVAGCFARFLANYNAEIGDGERIDLLQTLRDANMLGGLEGLAFGVGSSEDEQRVVNDFRFVKLRKFYGVASA